MFFSTHVVCVAFLPLFKRQNITARSTLAPYCPRSLIARTDLSISTLSDVVFNARVLDSGMRAISLVTHPSLFYRRGSSTICRQNVSPTTVQEAKTTA